MCGFIAYRSFGNAQIHLPLLKQMNRLQNNRGPDASMEFICDDGKTGLAHTRLSIIDLSQRAHQPMQTGDGKHLIVYNGEMYNFKEIRALLEKQGECFKTTSDTEVVLKSLRRWGRQALQRFEGIFAFAYINMQEGYVLAARDRIGVKPMSFLLTRDFICFSSTISPLTLLPGFTRDIDPVARFEMLISKYVSAPRSIFKGIQKVEPGAWMQLSFSGNITRGKFWEINYNNPANCYKAEEQEGDGNKHVDSLKSAIEKSVKRQLVSDVPVGVFLSGGIDSAIVAAVAQKYSPGIKSFTVGYSVSKYDESEDAKETSEFIGTDHHLLNVSSKDVISAAESISRIYDEPFGDASAIPTYLVSRFARQSVKVALSGDGGDEQFFGYSRYHRIAAWKSLFKVRPVFLKKILKTLADRRQPSSVLMHALTAMLGFPDEEKLYAHYMFDNFSKLAELSGAGKQAMLWDTTLAERHLLGYRLAANSQEKLIKSMMNADLLNYLPDDCLTKVDRASMASSLEVRVPLLDENVLGKSLNLPVSLLWKNRQGKHLLKQVLKEYLPASVMSRPKKGFGVPLDKWLFNEMKDYTLELLSKKNLLKAGLDPAGVQSIIAHHCSGRYDHQYFLWPLCCYVSWYLENGQVR